jgi:prophage regulatory protein
MRPKRSRRPRPADSASHNIKPLAAAPLVPHDVPRLLPLREVIARVGISRGQVYSLIGEQRFPRPVKVGRRSLWHSPEIDLWIANTIQQRDLAAAA